MSCPMSLLELFLRCLNAEYIHTSAEGDYALQIDPPYLYLLFEKSDGEDDWKNNLTFLAQKVDARAPKNEQWYAHRGFLKVWRAMREEVFDRIGVAMQKYDIQEIVCVGYSHGAALALLATEELSHRSNAQYAVEGYGFGIPRVVWGFLPNIIQNRLKNFKSYRNMPDLVTHLPPVILGFRHINLYKIGEKGKYGPLEAHTSQAYVKELQQIQANLSSTRETVLSTKADKSSSVKWFFRSAYALIPR